METINELLIKSLGLLNSNNKHFVTMKNTLFKIIIATLTFQIIKHFNNIYLDFSFDLILENLLDKIGMISIGLYLLLFGIFQSLIKNILPNFFIKKKFNYKYKSKTFEYLKNNNFIYIKLINSDPIQKIKISSAILEPYVFLFLIGCSLGINLISIIIILISLLLIISAGNIISNCSNNIQNDSTRHI